MVRKVAISFSVLLFAFLGFVATKPSRYAVSREIAIDAAAERIFPLLNGSKAAHGWSPWSEVDPDAKWSFSGPDAGVDSRSDWTDGKKLGRGSATVVESVPPQKVVIRLEYVEPMPMVQTAEYLLRSEGGKSVVTWRVHGENSFVGKLFGVFFDMDAQVGGLFEKGLARLKSQAEASK